MVDNFSFIDDNIAGSAYPNDIADLEVFHDQGISHIISLTPQPPLVSKYFPDNTMTFHHIPIYATPDHDQLDQFTNLIDELINNGEKAVVHCQYGQERTGIFLAYYLMKIKGMKVKEAILEIQAKRPSSLRTSHAQHFLLSNF